MAFEGSLHDFDIANIFQIISQQNKTGRLILTDNTKNAQVIFKNGSIVYSETDKQSPLNMICKYLEYVKKYSTTEISELRAIFHDNLRSLSRELLEKNYLSENELYEIIETTILDISCNIFLWKTGQYTFDTLPNTDKYQVGTFTISSNAVGMEAARQSDELLRMQEIITPNTVFISSSSKKNLNFDMVTLENLPHYLLQLIDGTSTVDFLCSEAFFSQYQIYEALKELFDQNSITSLSAKISSPVSAAIQRNELVDTVSISRSLFATLITVAIVMGTLFTGAILYRGILFKDKIKKQSIAANALNSEIGYNKLSKAKIQYQISTGKLATSFDDLIEFGLLEKRDLPTSE